MASFQLLAVLFLSFLRAALAADGDTTIVSTSTIHELVTITEYVFTADGSLTTVRETGGTSTLPEATPTVDPTDAETSEPAATSSPVTEASAVETSAPVSSEAAASEPISSEPVSSAPASSVASEPVSSAAPSESASASEPASEPASTPASASEPVSSAPVSSAVAPATTSVPPGDYTTSKSTATEVVDGTTAVVEYVVLYTNVCANICSA